jgi:hypothetical protein
MKTTTRSNPTEFHATIKLGIVVQRMTLHGLIRFVAKQQRLARKVFTCNEAGAFGYRLHRKLNGMGVICGPPTVRRDAFP